MKKTHDTTLEKLIRAAKAEFAKKGISRTKVEDITKRAGLGKGTFYLYFDTKTDVVRTMMNNMLTEVQSILKQFNETLAHGTTDYKDIFKHVLTLTLTEFYKVKEIIIIIKHSDLELGEELMKIKKKNMKKMNKHIAQLLENAKEAGYIRDINIQQTVELLTILCLNYSEEVIFREKKARIEYHASILEDFIMRGIGRKN